MKALHLNGNTLTLEEVREVAIERRAVLLDSDAREAVIRARAVVDNAGRKKTKSPTPSRRVLAS